MSIIADRSTTTERSNLASVLVRDLLAEMSVSTRLAGCLPNPVFDNLTVAQLLSGRKAKENLRMLVNNLGRKTADELVILVNSAVTGGSQGKTSLSDDHYGTVIAAFKAVPLAGALADRKTSRRLANRIEAMSSKDVPAMLRNASVADYLACREAMERSFGSISGFGTGVVEEVRDLANQIVTDRLAWLLGQDWAQQTGCAVPLTLADMLAREAVPGDLLHRLARAISSLPDDALTDPESVPVPGSVTEGDLLNCINLLDSDSIQVIGRRFGIISPHQETLEEIGNRLGITRERVRQIENNALRALRARAILTVFRAFLDQNADSLWYELSGGYGTLPTENVQSSPHSTRPIVKLAIAVAYEDIEDYLNSLAVRVPGGWSRGGGEALRRDAGKLRDLLKDAALPQPAGSVAARYGATPRAVLDLARLDPNIPIIGNFLSRLPKNITQRRVTFLHEILTEQTRTSLPDFRLIATKLKDGAADTSFRMLEAAMNQHSHLFLRLFEHFWIPVTALGPSSGAGLVHPESSEAVACGALDRADGDAVRDAIVQFLQVNGPSRFSEISAALTEGGVCAPGSVAPNLQMYQCFFRLADGVVGLAEHIDPCRDPVTAKPSPVISERQARLYISAKRAGEEDGLFLAWGPAYERALFRWARQNDAGEILAELLRVINPTRWPGGTSNLVMEREEAEKAVAGIAPMGSAHSAIAPIAVQVNPSRLLATMAYARMGNGISWVSANRIGLNKMNSGQSASTLGLLVAARALMPAQTWQDRHLKGPALEPLMEEMASHLGWSGKLQWSDSPMRTLLEAAGTGKPSGWLDPGFLQSIMAAQLK